MSHPQVVINVHGGLVQDVFVSDANTEVTLVDWHTDACDQADENVVEVNTHSGQKQRAYVAEYPTDDIEKLAGTDVALAIEAAGGPADCDGCVDGSGVRKNVDPGCPLEKPAGYTVIERCDQCEKFPDDLEAAAAVAVDPHLVQCKSGHRHAIGQLKAPAAEQTAYDVLLYPVVLLKVAGVVATSPRAAVEKACAEIGPGLCERFTGCGAEYAEEFSHFVVDVAGDNEFRQSRSYYSQCEPLVGNLARLVGWHDKTVRDQAELDRIVADARDVVAHSI